MVRVRFVRTCQFVLSKLVATSMLKFRFVSPDNVNCGGTVGLMVSATKGSETKADGKSRNFVGELVKPATTRFRLPSAKSDIDVFVGQLKLRRTQLVPSVEEKILELASARNVPCRSITCWKTDAVLLVVADQLTPSEDIRFVPGPDGTKNSPLQKLTVAGASAAPASEFVVLDQLEPLLDE